MSRNARKKIRVERKPSPMTAVLMRAWMCSGCSRFRGWVYVDGVQILPPVTVGVWCFRNVRMGLV